MTEIAMTGSGLYRESVKFIKTPILIHEVSEYVRDHPNITYYDVICGWSLKQIEIVHPGWVRNVNICHFNVLTSSSGQHVRYNV